MNLAAGALRAGEAAAIAVTCAGLSVAATAYMGWTVPHRGRAAEAGTAISASSTSASGSAAHKEIGRGEQVDRLGGTHADPSAVLELANTWRIAGHFAARLTHGTARGQVRRRFGQLHVFGTRRGRGGASGQYQCQTSSPGAHVINDSPRKGAHYA